MLKKTSNNLRLTNIFSKKYKLIPKKKQFIKAVN